MKAEDPAFDIFAEGCLTVAELAKEFGISKSKVYEMMSSGKLPWSNAFGRRLIPRLAVKMLLASQTHGDAAAIRDVMALAELPAAAPSIKRLRLPAGSPQTLADIDPAKVYTAEQIAAVIGCTRGDILKKCKAGQLGFECGGWRIAGAEVLAMARVKVPGHAAEAKTK